MSGEMPNERRRRIVQLAGLTVGGGLVGATGSASADDATTERDDATGRDGSGEDESADEDGLVTVRSDRDFETTLETIRARIESSPLTLIDTVDHAANAESVGRELPPTMLFVFGNPNVGTQLMQERRTVGIDLPQKLLVWCEDGDVNVTYNDPQYLADRHGIEGNEELLETISNALSTLATGDTSDATDD
ncbi:Uncharacterized conserved protein, DUF302 family [Halogranum amylolyticum]|uniref:Uncharacterized conserved protein, DUF302 family n=1 Tax=Halogranum amylolyticum TaxID=660520 RepID=A0A1H8TA63_9EURY|nr:DUF302 domain-containing protein [Halogranum amylolyticum]SEO87695.1 Uncharacterized conserved protein, DUF302 family [Halogranum amylolyticum]